MGRSARVLSESRRIGQHHLGISCFCPLPATSSKEASWRPENAAEVPRSQRSHPLFPRVLSPQPSGQPASPLHISTPLSLSSREGATTTWGPAVLVAEKPHEPGNLRTPVPQAWRAIAHLVSGGKTRRLDRVSFRERRAREIPNLRCLILQERPIPAFFPRRPSCTPCAELHSGPSES